MKQRLQAMLFALRHIGLLGWVGAMLALAAISYAMVIVPQEDDELSADSVEITRLQQRRMAMEKTPGLSPVANSQVKSATELPTVKTTPAALLSLEDIARQDKLQLKRNDYRYVDHIDHVDRAAPAAGKKAKHVSGQYPVVEVRIAMPSSGKYNDIRAFIAHALENLPTLALDGMSLKRDSIAQSDIHALLRFTLFVRGDS